MLFGNATTPAPKPPAQNSALVFDVTEADFEARVLMASMEKPVIVDFWAPWCGPCKQLGPLLEKAVTDNKGAVLMAKINVDENQQIAAALKIQSIPAVFAFFQGRPVDAFQGALPPAQIKVFIDKLVQLARQNAPDAIDIPEALKAAALALAAKDFNTAHGLYAQIINQDPNNASAYVGLVRMLIAVGDIAQARELVDGVPPEIVKQNTFTEARTALELAEQKPGGSLNTLAESVAKNPADHQARYDFALAQFVAGRKEDAMDSLLEIIRQNRGWNDEAARKQLLKFFEALGHSDPLTIQGRRKLSSILFS